MLRQGSLHTSAVWHDFGKDVQSTLRTEVRAKRLHSLPHNIDNFWQTKATTTHQLARFADLEYAITS